MMKRLTLILVVIALIVAILIPSSGSAYASDLKFDISSPSAIIIDEKTGDTLWEKNADDKRAVASTTKMMTAILALEQEELVDTITVSENALTAGRYGIKLAAGEQLTVEDLLYALMLNSANDVAIAIAEHIGGSVEKFIALMNKKAVRIGAMNTNFANPHGLTDDAHYSTARDLAAIARHGMKDKSFATIVAGKERKLNRADPKKPSLVENRNRLLWSYPGATGVKTGYTLGAGYCLVSSAETETVSLIAVVLGSKSQNAVFRDSAALLDHGFSFYEKRKLISKGKTYKTVEMKYGEKLDLVAKSDVEAFVRKTAETKTAVTSKPNKDYPVKKGTVLGRVEVVQFGNTVGVADLVAADDIDKPSLTKIMGFHIKRFWRSIF